MKKERNNKGFSLVELIVVVLIMGIIAVALAPQVMKWVGTARENSDNNQKKSIQSTVQTALADYQQYGKIESTDAVYLMDATSFTDSGSTDWTSGGHSLKSIIDEYLAGSYAKPQSGDKFKITVEGTTGKVTVDIE